MELEPLVVAAGQQRQPRQLLLGRHGPQVGCRLHGVVGREAIRRGRGRRGQREAVEIDLLSAVARVRPDRIGGGVRGSQADLIAQVEVLGVGTGRVAGRQREGAGVGVERRVTDLEIGAEMLPLVGADRAPHFEVLARRVAAGVVPDDGHVAFGVDREPRHGLAGDDLALRRRGVAGVQAAVLVVEHRDVVRGLRHGHGRQQRGLGADGVVADPGLAVVVGNGEHHAAGVDGPVGGLVEGVGADGVDDAGAGRVGDDLPQRQGAEVVRADGRVGDDEVAAVAEGEACLGIRVRGREAGDLAAGRAGAETAVLRGEYGVIAAGVHGQIDGAARPDVDRRERVKALAGGAAVVVALERILNGADQAGPGRDGALLDYEIPRRCVIRRRDILHLGRPGCAAVRRDREHYGAAVGGVRVAGELGGRVVLGPRHVEMAEVRRTLHRIHGQAGEGVERHVRAAVGVFDHGHGSVPHEAALVVAGGVEVPDAFGHEDAVVRLEPVGALRRIRIGQVRLGSEEGRRHEGEVYVALGVEGHGRGRRPLVEAGRQSNVAGRPAGAAVRRTPRRRCRRSRC